MKILSSNLTAYNYLYETTMTTDQYIATLAHSHISITCPDLSGLAYWHISTLAY